MSNGDPSVPQPFQVNIPDEEIERMRRIITDTRPPDSPPVPGASWDYGVDLDWLKSMRDAWLNEFDWKLVEQKINSVPQFTVVIESMTVHFIHMKSSRPDAIPLILLHGWPEFHRIVGLLTDPPADQLAFHVVVPSLPGFAFSSSPPRKAWEMGDNARIFDHLMTGVLGYSSYVVQGGDWGSLVSMHLGTDKYPACKLLQITAVPGSPTLDALLTLPFFLLPTSWRNWLYSKIYTEDEMSDFSRTKWYIMNGSGYFIQQLTHPFIIGYALYDSPVAILAWIGEKYKELMDPVTVSDPTAREFILTTISIYYLTNTFVSSALPDSENTKTFGQKIRTTKPYATSRHPHDVTNVPEAWIRAQHPNMIFRRVHQQGGHFPGYETPELLAAGLRELAASGKSLFC